MSTSIDSFAAALYTEPTKEETTSKKDTTNTTAEQTTSDGNVSIKYETVTDDPAGTTTEEATPATSGDSGTSDDGVVSDFASDLLNVASNLAVKTAITAALESVSDVKSSDRLRHEWVKEQSDDSEEGAEVHNQDINAQDNSQWWTEQQAHSIFFVDSLTSDGNQDLADLTRRPGIDALLETGNFKV